MSTSPKIALLTEDRYEDPVPGHHWYTDNILEEDRLLTEGLRARGVGARRISWSRAEVDWSAWPLALLRTTWDYVDRFDEFMAWLGRVEARTTLLNPPSLLRWNVDKRYLWELERRGVHSVPGVLLEQGSPATLAELMQAHGLDEAVLKPVISSGARHTQRVRRHEAAGLEAFLAERLRHEAMMLQPFQREIVERGEVTLVVIDGAVTHGLRKVAKPGDFRVQDDHGGTVHPHEPSADEIELAERAMATCDPAPIYGRVDMVRDNDGRLAVMELELVEPELWLRLCPAAADRLADAVVRTLG